MKYLISYFYNIRFMTPNMLPISTAARDPAWFHQNMDNNYRFLDNNCVLNGFRMDELVMPQERYSQLIRQNMDCTSLCNKEERTGLNPCPFMVEYAKYLRETFPNFSDFLAKCDEEVERLNSHLHFGFDTIVFIVHEAPSRGCAERPVIQDWFRENGYELEEFEPCKKELI